MTRDTRIETFTDPQFAENGYIVWRRDDGPCWIIDPGFPPAPRQICAYIAQHRLTPEALILTHGHLDHIAGVRDVIDAFPSIPVYMANEAKDALTDPQENLSAGYGLPMAVGEIETTDLPADGALALDGSVWKLYDTSGHGPGSRSLYCEAAGIVIVGDALFQGSIGRTDFHHSNPAEFIRNIKEKLLSLPDQTLVYSGHGPVTTIGAERTSNPFLQDESV